jgi:hypothetical protein
MTAKTSTPRQLSRGYLLGVRKCKYVARLPPGFPAGMLVTDPRGRRHPDDPLGFLPGGPLAVVPVHRAGRLPALVRLLEDRLLGALVRAGLLALEVHSWQRREVKPGWVVEVLRLRPEDFDPDE